MFLVEYIENARTAYLAFLRDNPDCQQALPKHEPHEEDLSYINASDLGYCPLRSYLKRTKAPFARPQVEVAPDLWQRMEIGKRVGQLYQEALTWYSDKNKAEVYFRNDTIGVKGKIDVLIESGGIGDHLLEIKSSDAYSQEWELRLPYIWQTLAYGLTYPDCTMHILSVKWREFVLWTFHKIGDGYIIENQHGHRWPSEFNSPDYINEQSLYGEISRHRLYIDRKGNFQLPVADPYTDKFQGWQCAKKKGNFLVPACGHACHFGDQEKVKITEEGAQWPPLF